MSTAIVSKNRIITTFIKMNNYLLEVNFEKKV